MVRSKAFFQCYLLHGIYYMLFTFLINCLDHKTDKDMSLSKEVSSRNFRASHVVTSQRNRVRICKRKLILKYSKLHSSVDKGA